MAVLRRSTPTEGNLASGEALRDFDYRERNQQQRPSQSEAAAARASNGLSLPLHLTNAVFILMIFSVVYSLLHRWRGKVQSSTPLRLVSFSELTALVALFASVVYLIGFFGIGIVHSLVSTRGSSDDEAVENEENSSVQPPPASAMREKKINAPADRCIIQEGSIESCIALFTSKITLPLSAADEEIVNSVLSGTTPSHSLESRFGDCRRAAAIRREALQRSTGKSLEGLPLEGFDYESILGQCCEMPVGYVQIPVGIVGPLLLDGKEHSVPMATTEGVLVASTNRGCKAIFVSGGATSVVLKDGMTRASVVRFDSAKRAAKLKFFLEDPENFDTVAVVFNRSSRFARLHSIKCAIAGRNLYIRFCCSTGDAMGMNMVSKGVQNVLDFLQNDFPDMDVIGQSGNYCSDKKPTAINWIEGRGKSVVCEAIINEGVIKKVLKTSVESLVELNTLKNLAGSAVAGALGGFNAHASNIVTAIYLATGQDPAQNVESSQCITMMEAVNGGKDLHVSVTMPSIEVGTFGGGTQLASQSACLNLLGLKGANRDSPGENSRLLATIVAGSVLAGELSLMSAIASGQLVQSHMKYNRSSRELSDIPS